MGGPSLNWPSLFTASANMTSQVTVMRVLVDGQQIYATDRDIISTNLKIFHGTHQVSVVATDSAGGTASAAINVNAEPGDLSPVAAVNVTPMPELSPNSVLVCTAGSKDPDGFLISTRLQFSDGTVATTPAVLHTFAAPGTYSVTATVTDQFGASNSVTQTFVVTASQAAQNSVPPRLAAASVCALR